MVIKELYIVVARIWEMGCQLRLDYTDKTGIWSDREKNYEININNYHVVSI
jgi:hypothetical protein